jgi:hypothetical protein
MGQKEKKGAARGGEIKIKKEGTLTRESRQQQPQIIASVIILHTTTAMLCAVS